MDPALAARIGQEVADKMFQYRRDASGWKICREAVSEELGGKGSLPFCCLSGGRVPRSPQSHLHLYLFSAPHSQPHPPRGCLSSRAVCPGSAGPAGLAATSHPVHRVLRHGVPWPRTGPPLLPLTGPLRLRPRRRAWEKSGLLPACVFSSQLPRARWLQESTPPVHVCLVGAAVSFTSPTPASCGSGNLGELCVLAEASEPRDPLV